MSGYMLKKAEIRSAGIYVIVWFMDNHIRLLKAHSLNIVSLRARKFDKENSSAPVLF